MTMELAESKAIYAAALEQSVGNHPLCKAALERFLSVGFPTHHDEEWKYTSLRHLGERAGFQLLGACRESVIEPGDHHVIKIIDGTVTSVSQSLAVCKGLTIIVDHDPTAWNTVSTFDGKLGSTNDPRFLDLNTALSPVCLTFKVDPGTVIEDLIRVDLTVTESNERSMIMPRIRMVVGQNAQLRVIESYTSVGATLTNAVTEVELARDARLEHTRYQDESLEATHIGQVWVHQEASSTYLSTNIQFGSAIGRCDINVYINGEHTETWLNGTYVGKGDQILDNHTRIDHALPNCHSFEVYKGILDDTSTGVFNGKIFVYEDAQKTDAKQTNQALLLSPTANINTKPQLEIFADDVKCTHGATVGQLRDDAMFYLRSRGIPRSEATNILVYAFAAEVIERVTDVELREQLEARLFTKLNGVENSTPSGA